MGKGVRLAGLVGLLQVEDVSLGVAPLLRLLLRAPLERAIAVVW
jgi:hypothetical protein